MPQTLEKRNDLLRTDTQRRVYEEMSAAGKRLFQRIAEKVVNLGRAEIMVRWEIGKLVADAIEDVQRYGERIVEQLAAAIGTVTAAELYKYRQFAEQFTQEEVAKALSLRTKSGQQITWTHFRALLALEASPEATRARKVLLRRIFEEDLSTRQTVEAVKEFFGVPRSKGRPPTPPKTAQAAIAQLAKYRQALSARMAGWVKTINEVMDLPPERCTEELTKYLTTAQDDCQGLLSQLQDLAKNLRNVTTFLMERLKTNTDAQSAVLTRSQPVTNLRAPERPSVPPPLPPLTRQRLEQARQAFRDRVA